VNKVDVKMTCFLRFQLICPLSFALPPSLPPYLPTLSVIHMHAFSAGVFPPTVRMFRLPKF